MLSGEQLTIGQHHREEVPSALTLSSSSPLAPPTPSALHPVDININVNSVSGGGGKIKRRTKAKTASSVIAPYSVPTHESGSHSPKEEFHNNSPSYDFASASLPPPAYPAPSGSYVDPDSYYHNHQAPPYYQNSASHTHYPISDYNDSAGRPYLVSDYPTGAVTPTVITPTDYNGDHPNPTCNSPDSSFYYFRGGGGSNSGYLTHIIGNNHGDHGHPVPTSVLVDHQNFQGRSIIA